ncbi:hypothetical protein Hamer_G026893 [Homarus americanus]|uniref:Uncharacterized protein n=1 Tax=Homarus americanus TaxID=6706 RepID=A0A8J5N5S8_HOMAM|nr:hypothetical protein Hamer_G026893 [Homarus americanus]
MVIDICSDIILKGVMCSVYSVV